MGATMHFKHQEPQQQQVVVAAGVVRNCELGTTITEEAGNMFACIFVSNTRGNEPSGGFSWKIRQLTSRKQAGK